jgi:hypothetical protein
VATVTIDTIVVITAAPPQIAQADAMSAVPCVGCGYRAAQSVR